MVDNVKRVTLRDISELTGFSINTVSRALNKKEEVRQAARAKILAAAHKLGYQPNRLAKGQHLLVRCVGFSKLHPVPKSIERSLRSIDLSSLDRTKKHPGGDVVKLR